MSKKFDLNAFKKTIQVADTPLKKDQFIELDDCVKEVIGLPGLPLGHITQIFGVSDSGKTSLMFHAAAQAQKQGILPVMVISEGKVDWDRAAQMGFDRENAIIEENLDFLEDVFDFEDKIIAKVGDGSLPMDVMIFHDSVGNTLSRDEVEIQKDGTWEKKSTMMKAAKVLSERMRVIAKKINDTRKISYPKTVGLTILNTAYTQPPQFPGGPSKTVPYGGSSIWYKSTLVLKTSRVKKLSATKEGKDFGFGIVSKITVEKNHMSNVTNSGEFVITADSIIPNEPTALKDYKERARDSWGNFELTEEE